jgi:hypothetical protein
LIKQQLVRDGEGLEELLTDGSTRDRGQEGTKGEDCHNNHLAIGRKSLIDLVGDFNEGAEVLNGVVWSERQVGRNMIQAGLPSIERLSDGVSLRRGVDIYGLTSLNIYQTSLLTGLNSPVSNRYIVLARGHDLIFAVCAMGCQEIEPIRGRAELKTKIL